jgi:hypothetical protein
VQTGEGGGGYSKLNIAPHPCERLGFARCSIDTVRGLLESAWYYSGENVKFEFTIPEGTEACITLPDGRRESVTGGSHCYTVAVSDITL